MNTSETYTVANIKELGISLKDLYANKKQINIHLASSPYVYTLVLSDRKGQPDCKISSFGANLYTRTNKGVNYEKYKNVATLQTAVKKQLKNKVLNVGEIRFSLSSEISFI